MSPAPTNEAIAPDELLARIEDVGTVIVDVREPDEFASWRIPGARNIPLGTLGDRAGEIPEATTLVTVCAAGVRAAAASQLLTTLGRSSVVLDGGMASWSHAYDVVAATLAGATVLQVRRRGKGCLSYVIGAGASAAVLDPSLDVDRYVALARDHGFCITHVIDTHLHADHVSGARALARATGAELLLNPADPFTFPFTPLANGQRVDLDDDTHLAVASAHAPGHTQGSTVFQLGDAALFSGDTLFLESVGRPDLADQAEAYARDLYHTLHEIVLALADETLVLPAHFGDSVEVRNGVLLTRTLGDLRITLPALAYDEATFVKWAVDHASDRPGNYREIVAHNAGATDRSLDELRALEVGPNHCAIATSAL